MKDCHLRQVGSGKLQITCLRDTQPFPKTSAPNFSALPSVCLRRHLYAFPQNKAFVEQNLSKGNVLERMQLNFIWDSLKECMLATEVLWRIFKFLGPG